MKIVLYNIGYGTGLKGSLKEYLLEGWKYLWAPKTTIKKIGNFLKKRKVDVICLLETDIGSIRARWDNQVAQMARRVSAPFVSHLSKYHPFAWFGGLPFFKHQHDAIISRVKGALIPHYFNIGLKNLVQEYVVGNISIFVVHLGLLGSKLRKEQLKQLTVILKECPRKFLVLGDFNIFDGIDELKDFIKDNTLKFAHKSKTFPSFKPKRMLDVILTCKDITVKAAGVFNVPYSDHLPVWVEIDC